MNARDKIKAESDKSPAQLEREIDEHRRHIEETVSALEMKMSPQHLWEQALSHGAGGGREFASRLGETVKTHPVPAVLTAIGLTWLYAGDRHAQHANGNGIGHGNGNGHGRMHDLADGASDRLGAMKDKASDSAHGAMDAARDVAHTAKHQAHRASAGFQHMLESNPLPLGAMGIAVGAILGALIPSTRKEDELMGEASDRLAGQAKEKAREVKHKVGDELRDAGGGSQDHE